MFYTFFDTEILTFLSIKMDLQLLVLVQITSMLMEGDLGGKFQTQDVVD